MKFLNKKNSLGLNLPYFIAEIGVNHGCSISLAKKQILLAKKNGAHAVKFQSYKAETITSVNSPSYWNRKFEKTANIPTRARPNVYCPNDSAPKYLEKRIDSKTFIPILNT